MARRLVVEADGGSRGNPGRAGYGALVRDADTGEVLAEAAEPLGRATNNVAEYRGLIAGLRAAARIVAARAAADGIAGVEVRMDSKLVVEQMAGRWQVKHAGLRPLAREASALAGELPRVRWRWVPRAENVAADALANRAMDGERVSVEQWRSSADPSSDPTPAPSTAGAAVRTVFLARHAATAMTESRRFSGLSDPPLNGEGERQAERLAGLLASVAGSVAGPVVSSPLVRAARTAEIVAARLGVPVALDPDWRECDFGAWEGLTLAEVGERHPASLAAWRADPLAAPPGGESLAATAERVRAAWGRLSTAASPVVVVTHATVARVLACLVLGVPLVAGHRLGAGPAGFARVEQRPAGVDMLRSWNESAG